MNVSARTFVVLVCLAVATGVAAQDGSDILAFRNGDRLHGNLLGIDGTGALQWRHVAAAGEIAFAATNIDYVDLANALPDSTGQIDHVVSLSNGDTVEGHMLSMDEGVVKLDTAFGRPILVQRSMIASIAFNHTPGKVVYEGPDGTNGWSQPPVQDGAGWVFEQGELRSRYPTGLGREIALPDMALIEFSCFDEQGLRFRFDFYSDRPLGFQPSTYFMELDTATVRMGYVDRNVGQRLFGGVRPCPYQPGAYMHYRIYINGKASEISLVANGTFVASWKDASPFSHAGNVISFQPRTVGTLHVGNIRVTEWDGSLPAVSDEVTDPQHDVVHLTNGDSAAGHMKSIVEGVALMQTAFTSATLPLERIARIDLAAAKAQRPRFYANDVRLYYVGQGRLTLRLEKIEQSLVVGYSESIGRVEIPLAWFRRIRLNPYENFDDPEFAELPF